MSGWWKFVGLLPLVWALGCSSDDDSGGGSGGTSGAGGSAASGGSSGSAGSSSGSGGSSGAGGSAGSAGSSAISASLVASRTGGPAPLAVLFDATATESSLVTLPFHELEFEFDFGDPNSGAHAVSGEPRNTERGGPIAAHLFEQPGSYVVTLTVTSGSEVATTSVTIEVEDPAVHWAGAGTIVVSPSSNFAGAPPGAEQRTTLPSSYAGKRVLLRRGESFGTIDLPGTADDVQIGSFGAGDKPVVSSVQLGGNGNSAEWPDDVTVMDLDIQGGFGLAVTGSRILVLRNDLDTPSGAVAQLDVATAFGYHVENGNLPESAYSWPREVFVVENVIRGDTNDDAQPNIAMMGFFMKSAIVGNTIDEATEHSLRIWAANKTFIAHNRIGGNHHAEPPPGIRHALKLHSAGTSDYDDAVSVSGLDISSRHLVIAHNRMGSSTYPGSWTVALGPQNADIGTVEPVIDVIYENNVHERGPHTVQDLHAAALRCTTRGNEGPNGSAFEGEAVKGSNWNGDPGMVPFLGSYFGQLQ